MNTLAGEGHVPGPLWGIGKTGTFKGSEGLTPTLGQGPENCSLSLSTSCLPSELGPGGGGELARGAASQGREDAEEAPASAKALPPLPSPHSLGGAGDRRDPSHILTYSWVWFVFEGLISALWG